MAAYHAASRHTENGIILLHKIVKGASDGSFGVEVAKQACLPVTVLDRAHHILSHMKQDSAVQPAVVTADTQDESRVQQMRYTIEQLKAELEQERHKVQKLHNIDIENMTPKQAFDTLWSLQQYT